jgi:hypothetical protein
MRANVGLPVVMAALVVGGGADAQAGRWVTRIGVFRSLAPYSEDPTMVMQLPYSRFSSSYTLLTEADIPADLRTKTFTVESYLKVEVDGEGAITACRPFKGGADLRLDAAACRALPRRGRFAPAYTGPGRMLRTFNVAVVWRHSTLEEAIPVASMPSAPPPRDTINEPIYRAWPRMLWGGELSIDRFPDLQASYDSLRGSKGKGETSLDLVVDPNGAIACEVGVASGDPRFDARACEVARALPLSYLRVCSEDCRQQRLPLKFVWQPRGSYVAVPMPVAELGIVDTSVPRDPADPRPAPARNVIYLRYPRILSGGVTPAALADMPGRAMATAPARFRVALTTDGRAASCTIEASTGSAAIDARLCEQLGRTRWEPRVDVFLVPLTSFEFKIRLPPIPPPGVHDAKPK